jgi:probable rRNA maturation factor
LAAHAAHLTIHGILHLLGYDHEHPKDAEIMENLEISLLDKMRIANPYRPEPVRQRGRQPKLEKCLKVPAR